MMFGMVFFWVAIILVIAYATKGGRNGTAAGDRRRAPSAARILEERFARGEISEDEFQERSRVLGRQGT